jgi:integrase/recombinase XerD
MYGKRKYVRSAPKINTNDLISNYSLTEIFERFIAYKKTEGLLRRTIEDYETHFRYLLEFTNGDVPNEQISVELCREYISWMIHERGLAPGTVNIRIRTLRAFLRFAFNERYIGEPIHQKIKLLKTEEDTIESFTPSEIKALLAQPDTNTYVGFRDFCMICTLLDTMVRISELLAIKRYNVNLKEGTIKLEAHETKTRRARTVPISSKTSKLLDEYIKETEDFGEEILFLSYDGRPILANTWRRRLSEYGEQAGIRNKQVSPHVLRHTGALLYIINGGDPFSLQKILGHSDMSMVRKYIQMTNADIKRQHNIFSPLKNIRI